MIHLTIETKVNLGIIIVIIRPTFYVQNTTDLSLSVKGLSLHLNSIPRDKEMNFEQNVVPLDPNDEHGANDNFALSLLAFNCDWNPITEINRQVAGMKYIALQYGSGPWWFVQLMKFETIFNNVSAPQGVPVKRAAVSIPSCQPQW